MFKTGIIEKKLDEVNRKIDVLTTMQLDQYKTLSKVLGEVISLGDSFINYRKDVMFNIEKLIDTIYKDTQCYKDNMVFSKVASSQQVLFNQLSSLIGEVKKDTNNITRVVSLHNNENEIIRQNLHIQEDLRRCEDDLTTLQKQLNSIVVKIDSLLS